MATTQTNTTQAVTRQEDLPQVQDLPWLHLWSHT